MKSYYKFKHYNINNISLTLILFILNDLINEDKEWFLNKVLTNLNNIFITIEKNDILIGYSILKLNENKISRLKILEINKGYGVKLLDYIKNIL